MSPEILINLLVGILAGWVIIVFQEPYNDIREVLLKNEKIPNIIINVFMPVIGLLVLMGAVLLIVG